MDKIGYCTFRTVACMYIAVGCLLYLVPLTIVEVKYTTVVGGPIQGVLAQLYKRRICRVVYCDAVNPESTLNYL